MGIGSRIARLEQAIAPGPRLHVVVWSPEEWEAYQRLPEPEKEAQLDARVSNLTDRDTVVNVISAVPRPAEIAGKP